MRHRIVLSDEQRAALDAAVLDGITAGLSSNSELSEHVKQSLGSSVPPRPALEYGRYVDSAVKRLRTDRKIRPAYTTPRGAARGGWRLA